MEHAKFLNVGINLLQNDNSINNTSFNSNPLNDQVLEQLSSNIREQNTKYNEEQAIYEQFYYFRNTLEEQYLDHIKSLKPDMIDLLNLNEINKQQKTEYTYNNIIQDQFLDVGTAVILLQNYGNDTALRHVLQKMFAHNNHLVNNKSFNMGIKELLNNPQSIEQVQKIKNEEEFIAYVQKLSQKSVSSTLKTTKEQHLENKQALEQNTKEVLYHMKNIIAEMIGTYPNEHLEMIKQATNQIIKKININDIKFVDNKNKPLPIQETKKSLNKLKLKIKKLKKEDKQTSNLFNDMKKTVLILRSNRLNYSMKQRLLLNTFDNSTIKEKLKKLKKSMDATDVYNINKATQNKI